MFYKNGSIIRQLILLRLLAAGGTPATTLTVTGVSPLALVNALAHSMVSLTQYGKCVQEAGASPSTPKAIYCNNGKLEYGALGANLFDPSPSAILLNYYRIPATGVVTASNPNFMTAGYIPVKPNTSYVLVGRSKSDNTISAWNRIYWFDADKEFISTSSYTQDKATVAVSPANAAYAQYGINYNNSPTNVVTQAEVDSYNWTFCEGTAEPATFVPFVGGMKAVGTPEVLTITADGAETQTVTDVPMLLSVGDIKDELELISGHADRAITAFRVSPDMNWSLASGSGYKQFYTSDTQGQLKNSVSCMSNIAPYGCTASNRASYQHGCYTGGTGNLCFQMIGEADINTVDDWKAFLRVNDVYVVAAKATETTEQTTPHSLHTAQGTNVVSVTAEVSDIILTAEYKGVAA